MCLPARVCLWRKLLLLLKCGANSLTFKSETQNRERGALLPGDSVASHIGDTMG